VRYCVRTTSRKNGLFKGRLISYFGKHSLEIYLANVLILYIYQIWDLSRINRAIVYIPFQIVLSSILIFINTRINMAIEHKDNKNGVY